MRQKYLVSPYFGGLSDKIKKMWRDPDFMTNGGVLGFYCQHTYAHTNTQYYYRGPYDLVGLDPYALKGEDAVFYSIFHYMGLEVEVLAVTERPYEGDLREEEDLPDEEDSPNEEDLPDEGYENYISDEPEAPDNKLDESLKGQQESKDLLNEGGKGSRLIGSGLEEITMTTNGKNSKALPIVRNKILDLFPFSRRR